MKSLADFTYEDWRAWMEATPKGLTIYVDREVIDHIGTVLATQQRYTAGDDPVPSMVVWFKNLVCLKDAASLTAKGYANGEAHARQDFLRHLDSLTQRGSGDGY